MYKCSDCDSLFEEPKKYTEDMTPGGYFEGGSFIYGYYGCPYCSGNYEEYKEVDDEDEYDSDYCVDNNMDCSFSNYVYGNKRSKKRQSGGE